MLDLACKKLNIKADVVLSHKEYDDHISLVVDYGIGGGKKFNFFLADLVGSVEAKKVELKEAQKVDAESKGVKMSFASDADDKPRRKRRK